MRGPEGETALHLAAAGGHHEVVKFLLSEGADADIQDDVRNINFLMYSLFLKFFFNLSLFIFAVVFFVLVII